MKKQQVIILLFLLCAGFSYGQVRISGKIYEINTNRVLFNCSITTGNGKSGTISNEEGEFELTVDNSEKKIFVSHLGYKRETIDIGINENLEIFLEPASISLKAAIVGNPALAYLNLAIEKSTRDSLKKNTLRDI